MDDWLSVADAAHRLHVSERRVRQLIDAGELEVGHVGPHRVVDAASVRRRAGRPPAAGRPLGQALAWIVVDQLSTDAGRSSQSLDDRRLRHRLRRLLDEEHSASEWALLLRRRADRRRYWGHPDLARDLLNDGRLSWGGARGAAAHGLDVAATGGVEFYVDLAAVHSLEQEYALEPDARGAVLLHAYDGDLPFTPTPGQPAPIAAVALDLLDSTEVRLGHLAGAWLARAIERLGATAP